MSTNDSLLQKIFLYYDMFGSLFSLGQEEHKCTPKSIIFFPKTFGYLKQNKNIFFSYFFPYLLTP